MKKLVCRLALVSAAVVVAYGTVLAYPAPLFRHEADVSGISVFSRRPLEPGLAACLAESLARVQASGIYDAALPMMFFEAGSPGWYRFFNGPYSGALARHSELGGNIFVPKLDVRACAVEHFDGRSAPIAVIAAHEMTHRLMQHRLGLYRLWRLPWWKREGFAEFVARKDSMPLAQRVAQFDSSAPSEMTIPRRYLEALIVTRYSLEVRRDSFDDFIADRRTLSSAWDEIRRLRLTPEPGPAK